MVFLTDKEISWLKDNLPMLDYDKENSILKGIFPFSLVFNNVTIRDSYALEIDFGKMRDRYDYPIVRNYDGKIQRIAKRKNMDNIDFHVYSNNLLCLGIKERFHEYYPEGFEIELFFKHMGEHLYWISYLERYNKAPWPAEAHGTEAIIDYFIEKKDIHTLRKYYNVSMGKGISKQKIRNYLMTEKSRQEFKKLISQLWMKE